MNQPPCNEPSCGTAGEDCCTGNKCRAGLICKGSVCEAKNACGGVGEACCVHLNPVCSNPLLKCIDKVCAPGIQVSDLTVTLRTNDEDKDDDSGLRIAIDGLAHWEQNDNTHYVEWSTHTWSLSPSVVRLDDLAGRYFSICMLPNGDDTWKFNFVLQGNRSDGLKYELRRDNVFLSTDVPCLSWNATPDPTPQGPICADKSSCSDKNSAGKKCLTVTKGGAVPSVVALNDCTNAPDQQWVLTPQMSAPAPDGARIGQIRRPGGTQCLGLPGGKTASGTFIDLQNCNGSPGQQWKWFASGNDQITGPLSHCLDSRGKGLVIVTTGNTTSTTTGSITPSRGTLVGTSSNQVLEYADCDGSPQQTWMLPACGAVGAACCNSGIPCQGVSSCKQGVCSADSSNVNFLQATLDTTNEDKDADTQVVITGLWSWPGDGNTHYDDWSTHLAVLSPSSTSLASIQNGSVTLHSSPNGEDNWKVNFIVNGVRDDGAHYEFRKDNVWLANGDHADTYAPSWTLGPPPLDLVWNDTDANGLPLNPTWRGYTDGEWLDEGKVCAFHASPLAGDLNDYGRCSSQSQTYDRSWLCGWHANWFPVAMDGIIPRGGGKNNPMRGYIFFGWGDDDFHVDLSPLSYASNFGRSSLVTEFDSDETTDEFRSNWWKDFDDDDDVWALADHEARIIGLYGIDTEHGPHGELHPVYVITVRAPRPNIPGGDPILDTWGVFIRNWGNEGACGGSQHYLDLTQFTLRFQAPPGAEAATSVVEQTQTGFDAGSESGSDWSGFSRSSLSPVQHDANGTFVEMTFNIGPPEDHTFIDGNLSIGWKCGNDFCKKPPPPPQKPTLPPAAPQEEADVVLPGADLLTSDQVSQLQQQFPARPPAAHGPSRPIAITPFTGAKPQVSKVGQGSMADRAVPDNASQQRTKDAQKKICQMLANNPKRPAICNSLP
jgi:hypothetical protein